LVVEIAESENLAVVVVSHDVEDIVAMATRVVLFEPGATVGTYDVEQGNPASVLEVLARQQRS
jgi:ABC-type nitrate/sulfonate/bicarbonate transport system ATPase subunit